VSSKYYVVFEDDNGHWWSPFLKKNIRQCYLIKPCGEGHLVYGKNTSGFDLFTTTEQKSIIDDNYILCSYKAKSCKQPLFMLNTCVGHTKRVLGINNPLILTPYQLLKYLRKSNEKTKDA
jgi:hypothetical protein